MKVFLVLCCLFPLFSFADDNSSAPDPSQVVDTSTTDVSVDQTVTDPGISNTASISTSEDAQTEALQNAAATSTNEQGQGQ